MDDIPLRKGAPPVTIYSIDIEREIEQFLFTGESIYTAGTILSFSERFAKLHIAQETNRYTKGDTCNIVWQERKRNFDGTIRRTGVVGKVVRSHGSLVVIQCDGQKLKEGEMDGRLKEGVWVQTKVQRLVGKDGVVKSPFIALPCYTEGKLGWSFISTEECVQKYSTIITLDNAALYSSVHGLSEDCVAVPTLQFLKTPNAAHRHRLDSFTFGSVALAVKRSSLPEIVPKTPPLSIRNVPKLTIETQIRLEGFTPRDLVLCDKAKIGSCGREGSYFFWTMCGTTVAALSLDGASLLNYEEDMMRRSLVRIDFTESGILRFTSKPFVHMNTLYIGVREKTRGFCYMVFSLTDLSDTQRPKADFRCVAKKHLKLRQPNKAIRGFFLHAGAVEPVTDFDDQRVIAVFDQQNNNQRPRFFFQHGSSGDQIQSSYLTCDRKQMETVHIPIHTADIPLYFSSCAEASVHVFKSEEDGDTYIWCTIKCTPTTNDNEKEITLELAYVPLCATVTYDEKKNSHTLWLSGKRGGVVTRIHDVFSSTRKNEDVSLETTESVVEFVHKNNKVVYAVTLTKVFKIDESFFGGGLWVPLVISENMYGVSLAKTIENGGVEDLSNGGFSFCPIEFYPGIRLPIDLHNRTIERLDGAIYSIDMGGEHDVLVNAKKEDFVIIQHLLDFIMVKNDENLKFHDEEQDAFVLRFEKQIGFGNVDSKIGPPNMALSNDAFACVRSETLYPLIMEKKNFFCAGEIIHPFVVVSRCKDGFCKSEGIICSFMQGSRQILKGTILYYPYGEEFWDEDALDDKEEKKKVALI